MVSVHDEQSVRRVAMEGGADSFVLERATFGLVGLFLGPIALYLSRELVKILHRDTHDASADQPALPPAGVIGGEAAPQL